MIEIVPLARRRKLELASEIATYLSVEPPTESNGSSIDSMFLDLIHERAFGSPNPGSDTYRKTEEVLNNLQVSYPYDPWWDTSEAQGRSGGGTVTARAFSRILVALTGNERCFMLDSSLFGDNSKTITFTSRPAGNALADAGPGSLIIRTERINTTVFRAVSIAVVTEITPGWSAPWQVHLDYEENAHSPEFTVQGTPRPVTEISFVDYQLLTGATFGHGANDSPRDAPARPQEPKAISVSTVAHLTEAFPLETLQINTPAVPAEEHEVAAAREAMEPQYVDTEPGRVSESLVERRSRQNVVPTRLSRSMTKLLETRAIEIVLLCLARDGWDLIKDRQRDGVGYDLLFERAGRTLKVEVKGVLGTALSFNLTPKEWWRAQTDPAWVLVVVLAALSPKAPEVRVLARSEVLGARRYINGYRLQF